MASVKCTLGNYEGNYEDASRESKWGGGGLTLNVSGTIPWAES